MLGNNNICKLSHMRSSDLMCASFVYEKTDVQARKTYTAGYMLGIVLRGSGVLNQNNHSYEIAEKNVFFINKDAYFNIVGDGDLAYAYISYFGRRADELAERFELSDHSSVFDLGDDFERVKSFIMNCLDKSTEHNVDIFGECALLYLLAHLDAKESVSNSLLSEIVVLTNNNFTSPSFSLSKLADMLGYSSKYISFFFKKNKGICYSKFLRDIRIKHAAFLMEQGITSVKNAALLSGFDDVLYFSKVFKSEMGKSPKEYVMHLERTRRAE